MFSLDLGVTLFQLMVQKRVLRGEDLKIITRNLRQKNKISENYEVSAPEWGGGNFSAHGLIRSVKHREHHTEIEIREFIE